MKVNPPIQPGHKNWHEKHQDQLSKSDMIADRVTSFAGTMTFIYVHFVWWGCWFLINTIFHPFDKYPFNLLTMLLSLEAILLATLIMISQNRQAARDKTQAEHQYRHQEMELKNNTDLTREVHKLTLLIKKHIEADKRKVQKRGANGRFRR